MVIYGHILSQRVAHVKEIKNKCKKCSKNYILWLQSCNTAIFTTAINLYFYKQNLRFSLAFNNFFAHIGFNVNSNVPLSNKDFRDYMPRHNAQSMFLDPSNS